jgi:hypothetical protein
MPGLTSGGAQLQALGLRLKALGSYQNALASADLVDLGGGKTLRSQLLAGIRAGVKPAIEAARAEARSTLPKHGGLNEEVATTAITVATRLTGPRVGVRVAVPKGRKRSNKAYGANKGNVRHPVFGKDRWVDQKVPSGWFDDTLKKSAPLIAGPVTAAMVRVAEEATRRLF